MIHLEGINKTYFNGAPLPCFERHRLGYREGRDGVYYGGVGIGEIHIAEYLGNIGYIRYGHLYPERAVDPQSERNPCGGTAYRMIGFIFQSFNLISFKNAVENVALPLYYQGVGRKKRNAMALEYLDMVGLKDWAEHMPNEMSGGQKQRVAIARALIARPQVILADEPTGALDSKTTVEVMELLRKVNLEGLTMVIVTHEPSVAEATDRIILRERSV